MSELSWVTGAELDEKLASTDIAVLVFFADASSDGCKQCLPHLEKLKDLNAGTVLFLAIDVNENAEAAKRYGFERPVMTRVFRRGDGRINVQQGIATYKTFKELIQFSLES